jgi:hypothetical protein
MKLPEIVIFFFLAMAFIVLLVLVGTGFSNL